MKISAGILAFYLLLGSFFPRNDFSQLLGLPYLLEHFQEHLETAKLDNQSIDFFDYLWMHFVESKDHKDSHDRQSHEKLPLHNSPVSFDYLFYMLSWPVKSAIPFAAQENSQVYSWSSSDFIFTVFRPPSK